MTRARERDRRDGETWYRISNDAGTPAQVFIYQEIGAWGVTAQDFVRDLTAVGDGPVEVRINSGGGDVFEAYAIYNALVGRMGVTTIVDSLAASAASVIAMAGERRLMARTSQMMIHDASAYVGGNADEMQHMIDRLETVSGQIAGIYADTAGGEPDHWRALMRAETWFTPQQALESGLITEITGTAREPAPASAGAASDAAPPGVITDRTEPPAETAPPTEQASPVSQTDPIPGNERNGTMPEDQGALTIEARRSRIGDIANRLTEIHAQYPAAVLPTEIQAEWDQLVTERRDNQAALDAVDSRNSVLALTHAARPQSHESAAPTITDSARPGAPAVHVQHDIYNLAEIRQQARSAEDLPRLYRENAIRAIDVARFPGSPREDVQERVTALLDTVREDVPGTLARRILASGSPGYKKAFGRALAIGNPGALGSTDARILALGESDTGSYAVPFELDPTVLLTSDGAINPLRQISRIVQITSKEYDLVTSAGVTVTRRAEAAPTTDGAPTLAQPTIKPERVDGFIPFSVEIEGDWTALQAEMMALLRDAKDVEEADSFTLGNGTPPAAGGIIGTLASGSNVAGSSGALAAGDPQKLEEALAPRFRTNASYMGSKTTLNAYRTLLIAAGYTYDAYVQATQGTPRQLFGYNAYECSDMVSTHASTDKPLIFGDFKKGFIIVDRVGMNMELVPTLTRQATAGAGVGMPTGQRGYFAWWRNNSRVLIDNAFRVLVVA
jgi:HK97 family phage major capsid protein